VDPVNLLFLVREVAWHNTAQLSCIFDFPAAERKAASLDDLSSPCRSADEGNRIFIMLLGYGL